MIILLVNVGTTMYGNRVRESHFQARKYLAPLFLIDTITDKLHLLEAMRDQGNVSEVAAIDIHPLNAHTVFSNGPTCQYACVARQA
jgi:hypothetical protein